MSFEQLVELSRFYGSNPQWVLAGGGNTSIKENGTLCVKASGTTLAEASDDTYVRMDRGKLAALLQKSYPADAAERERQALQDLMDAREAGQQRRPSVETLMHELMPFTFVVHTHPPLINGITCSVEAEEAARRVFGNDIVWIPNINPGLILAMAIREAIADYRQQHGNPPQIILLQNHGLVVGADSPEEVRAAHKAIVERVRQQIVRMPELGTIPYDAQRAELLSYQISRLAQELHPGSPEYRTSFLTNREVARFVRSVKLFYPLSQAFTPDHIVYAGHRIPLLSPSDDLVGDKQAISAALSEFLQQAGRIPPLVAVEGLGVFISGRNRSMMESSAALFLDAVQIAVYAESFGGASFLPAEQTEFILGWEVERFRTQVSAGE